MSKTNSSSHSTFFLLLGDMFNIYEVKENLYLWHLRCGETESTTPQFRTEKGVKLRTGIVPSLSLIFLPLIT